MLVQNRGTCSESNFSDRPRIRNLKIRSPRRGAPLPARIQIQMECVDLIETPGKGKREQHGTYYRPRDEKSEMAMKMRPNFSTEDFTYIPNGGHCKSMLIAAAAYLVQALWHSVVLRV